MKLVHGKVTSIVEDVQTENFLVIRCNTPTDAKIFINDEYVGRGEVSKYLPIYREHSYRVEAPLYHTEEGRVRLSADNTTVKTITLKPSFGYLEINTNPQGATIEINGEGYTQLTPFITQRLPSGVYTIKAFKEMYKEGTKIRLVGVRLDNLEDKVGIPSDETNTATGLYKEIEDLLNVITEDIDNSFYLAKSNWYKENNIIEILGVNVDSIDRENNLIRLDNKQGIHYDKLILANGSYNFVPPTKVKLSDSEVEINSWTYNTVKGIHTIKKLEDVNILKEELPKAKNVTIIGGGLLGLEAAWEIQKRNINVTVIELADKMLPRQLDTDGSKLFESLVNKTPVKVLLGSAVDFINADNEGVNSIQLKNGEVIDTDAVIFSVGVRSNIFLAQPSGINCNRGVIVNDYMQTNISNIYACGDIAEHDGVYYGNWPAAIEMGKVAGANATGDKVKFEKFVSSTIFQAMNTQVFSAGTINFDDPTLEKVGYVDSLNNKYSKLFFQNNKLVGGILIGDVSTSAKIMEGIQKGENKATVLSKGTIK